MDSGGTIDRRQLIKRAAVVGGAVWTAPLIIESVTASAAAVTVVCSCPPGTTIFKTKIPVDGSGATKDHKVGGVTIPGTSWNGSKEGHNVRTSLTCDPVVPNPGPACKPACWDSVIACDEKHEPTAKASGTNGATFTLQKGCTWLSVAVSGCDQKNQSSPGCAGVSEKKSGIVGTIAPIVFTGCTDTYAVYMTYCCPP